MGETTMTIRDAQAIDLPAIQTIMNYYRKNSTYIWERSALTEDDMKSWLCEHTRPPYAALAALHGDTLLGYASLSRFRPYSGYDYTAENSIYLAPGYEGKGLGSPLMRELLKRARQNGLRTVTSWIDSDNLNSVRFHEKFGFTHVGTLKNAGMLDGAFKSVVIMQFDCFVLT
jgi:phosphinothricin acetyltransferase